MLVFGGFDNGFRSNKVHRLNLNTNAWEYLRVSGPEPCPRSGHSAVISADLMIVFGGKDDENEKLNDVWIFDILAQTWKQVIYAEGALKPTARSGHSALLFNN
jgi:N-acetylneuraminic acid mutarotase